MLKTLVLLTYLVASLSASDAARGQTVRIYAGCDAGQVSVAPVPGLVTGPTRGSGLAQSVDLTVAADARPGLRYVRVGCAGAEAELHLTVREAGFEVFVPMVARSPGL